MPIIGRSAAAVASSCTDMLAGLSKCETCRIPPRVCAAADPAATVAAKRKAVTANVHRLALVIYAASVRCPWGRRGHTKAFPLTPYSRHPDSSGRVGTAPYVCVRGVGERLSDPARCLERPHHLGTATTSRMRSALASFPPPWSGARGLLPSGRRAFLLRACRGLIRLASPCVFSMSDMNREGDLIFGCAAAGRDIAGPD